MMVLLSLWTVAAGPVDSHMLSQLKTLKAEERSLLDNLDDLYAERARLRRQQTDAQSELTALQRVLREEQAAVAADAARTATVGLVARQTVLGLRQVVKGGGLRFVLGADSWGASLRRLRLLQSMLRRYSARLIKAEAALDKSQEQRDEWQHHVDYAAALLGDVTDMQHRLDAKNADINQLLGQVRHERTSAEHSFYEREEAEAKADEAPIVNDDFLLQRGHLLWPLRGVIRLAYGRHIDDEFGTVTFRSGYDIAAFNAQPVRAAADGTVVQTGTAAGYEQVVVVQHSPHYYTMYAGLGGVSVRTGAHVQRSDVLGRVGSGGACHFEVRRGAISEDPGEWLEK